MNLIVKRIPVPVLNKDIRPGNTDGEPCSLCSAPTEIFGDLAVFVEGGGVVCQSCIRKKEPRFESMARDWAVKR